MKKLLLLSALCLVLTTFVYADEITFTVVGTSNSFNVFADSAGFSAGPALNVLVSDTAKNLHFSLVGTFNASAGAASSFVITPSTVNGTFGAGGTNSVSVIGSSVFVEGDMLAGGDLGSTYPGGTGSFQSVFDVTQVDPAVLAFFGAGPRFDPRGAVSVTFGQTQVVNSELEGIFGGGSVTIVVSTIPEPRYLGFAGFGVLGLAGIYRKWQLSQ